MHTPADTVFSNLYLELSVIFAFTSTLKFTSFLGIPMDKEKKNQCFLLNSIYYQGRLRTEKCGGVENVPLYFPNYLKVVGAIN